MKSIPVTFIHCALFTILLFQCAGLNSCLAQSPAWKLWASGLPSGVYPRMAVTPNHDLYYTLLGTGNNLGYVYKANSLTSSGSFQALPQIPRPPTIQNNIVALGYNMLSEPIVGIYRTNTTEPWLFRLDANTNTWDTAVAPVAPSLGGHCIATATNGAIYIGTRWAYIYKSTDDGKSFTVIDETKSVKSNHPCYYPTYNGSANNGAIFSINIDQRGRIYAGTETAGIIYSDDEGLSWHPVDVFACQGNDPNKKDSTSSMRALTISGNAAAVGFTKENNVVWSGVDMWTLGWKNKMGYADLNTMSANEVIGLPDYLVLTGQQVSKIVTTTNGQLFFHSGAGNGSTQVGIYTSRDGIHWSLFNDGITGQNDGLSQGSLAVDGNKVFMATRDGNVWVYEDIPVTTDHLSAKNIYLYPNPVTNVLTIEMPNMLSENSTELFIQNVFGETMKQMTIQNQMKIEINLMEWPSGLYYLKFNGIIKFLKL